LKIQYLKNHEINFVRWDNCINNALNGSVFSYSWYLNILCEDWAALVSGDYKYVMPLIFKSEFKKDIFYSHKLGQRLGVFSNLLLSEDIVAKFINTIPEHNSLISISLNKSNKLNSPEVKKLKTYELDLIQSYKKISEKYSNQFQKDLQKAKENKITITKGLLPNDLINFSVKKGVRSKPILNRKQDIHKLRMIIANSIRFSLGETYCVYDENNTICAAAFFIKSKRKLHLLYATINKTGLKTNAFHLLIDKYIEVHSEKDLTLNIENVVSNNVEFYSGIGATEYKYNHYYKNKLPWIYKLLLKKY
jgi:hypothetical protein